MTMLLMLKCKTLATGNRVLGRATAGDVSEVQVSNDMLAGSIANAKLANDSSNCLILKLLL